MLVVDDEAYFGALLARSLQEEAGGALAFDFETDPQNALERATQLGPRLVGVVSDYDLKAKMCGLVLLGHVRRQHAEAKRILVTGHDLAYFEDEPEFALLDGAHEKPLKLTDITGPIIRTLLGSNAPTPPAPSQAQPA